MGLHKININDRERIAVEGGRSLLKTLADHEIFLPSACGGRAICGYCKVKVTSGGNKPQGAESAFLSKDQISSGIRLACQLQVDGDISIRIPDELIDIKQYSGNCTHIEELTDDISFFRLELTDPPEIDYTPGQYIELKIPPYFEGGEEVYRTYSIASDPSDKNVVELIIRRVPGGIGTTYCFDHLKTGDTVNFKGPYGDFHLSGNDRPLVFVAGGSGMAPIRSMLNHMRNSGDRRKAVYFFGVNKIDELFMLEEMRRFENQLNDFSFVPVVAMPDRTGNWNGETGLVTEAVRRNLKNAPDYEAYLCGSPGMIAASIQVLRELGMKTENIFYDSFA